MGLLSGLPVATASGIGRIAQSIGSLAGSSGRSAGGSVSSAKSLSNTAGNYATDRAIQQASTANSAANDNWKQAAQFNAEQAELQRQWQEKMANSTYQRTIADMKKAGINPILAANMGLGADSVGSGAAASMTAPQTFMGQTFAEQNSASQSEGSSWNASATGLAYLADAIQGLMNQQNGATMIDIAINGLDKLIKDTPEYQWYNDNIPEGTKNTIEGGFNWVKQFSKDIIKHPYSTFAKGPTIHAAEYYYKNKKK